MLVLLCCILAGCSASEGPGARDDARAQAIVLVTVDGLLTEQLELFGGDQATPALERLAADGTLWRDGWTVCPMTRPAVTTYLTGLAADRHGVRDDLFSPLDPTIPTLASLLSDRGYRTAAFPNSSLLGFGSGLLEGFEVVDEPPAIPVSPARWFPQANDANETAGHLTEWLASLPEEAAYFAWIHFSESLLEQLTVKPRQDSGDDPNESAPAKTSFDALRALDATVGAVLEALEARGDLEHAAVVLAGTSGDLRGDAVEPRGPGYSLHERALRVPVFASFPAGRGAVRPEGQPVWAPDVTATLAELAGVELPSEAEGLSLFENAAPDRTLFAWSWALRDQMGYKALRAARSGELKRSEGFDATTTALDGSELPASPEAEARLQQALDARANPSALSVPLGDVRELLEAHGLKLDPVAGEGRSFGTPEQRVKLSRRVWQARWIMRRGAVLAAIRRYRNARKIDGDNLAVLLDHGQIQAISQGEEAVELLGHAASRFPTDPEALHWFAHALWPSAPADVERILDAILPYKQQDAEVLYDLACVRSLAEDLESSERFLREAIGAGFRLWNHMDVDPDLRNLRESGRYSAVMREVRP